VSPLSRRAVFPLLAGSLGLAFSAGPGCRAPGDSAAHPEVDAAVRWLLDQQRADGAFPSTTYGLLAGGESLTPAVLLALLDIAPRTSLKVHSAVSSGLTFLATRATSAGAVGFSGAAPDYPVYATSMTVLAAARSGNPERLARFGPSVEWLLGQQLTGARGWTDSPALGGWPMGGTPRVPPHPGHVDLSMTRRALQALSAVETSLSGQIPALAPAARADAEAFVGGSQTTGGGFLYSKVSPGLNKAGATAGYGSATCDGLLALAALGLGDDDPRIERGLTFLRRIHRTDRNPGLSGGPFAAFGVAMKGYYRAASSLVFARWAWPDGAASAMAAAVLGDQRPGGFWRNEDVLQKEDDPLIATSFALQALAAALPSGGPSP
jgi:hypothetical protein